MKRRVLSVVLALCLCFSFQPIAYAQPQEASSAANVPEGVSPEVSGSDISLMATYDDLDPAKVKKAMLAFQEKNGYREGTTWTDYEPYNDKNYYKWRGGAINGKNIVSVGCVAFAFSLSDAAFGNYPNRSFSAGAFKFADVKVGDVVRTNTDTHTVIVLDVYESALVVAEGNYGGKVHWGRVISKSEFDRNASTLITRYPANYVAPSDPTANNVVAQGKFGASNKLSYTLTKAGVLTISGSGAIPDYSSYAEQPWYANASSINKVIIDQGVTAIGNCAFWMTSAMNVIIPSTVTKIGNYAFRQTPLVSVDVPSSVKSIGNDAFRQCTNLCGITFSEGLQTIGERAFQSCAKLGSVTFPSTITSLGAGAFFDCTYMYAIEFDPNTNKKVAFGDDLFNSCYYLMSVTLPKGIDQIGANMFSGCMLGGLEIPDGTKTIGQGAFKNSAMQVFIIPASITSIGISAFANCPVNKIYYKGSQAQWNKVQKIGDTANALKNVEIVYNFVMPTPSTPSNPTPSNPGTTPTTPESTTKPGTSGGQNAPTDSANSPVNTEGQLGKGQTFTSDKITFKVTTVGSEVEAKKVSSTSKKVTIDTVKGPDGIEYKVTSIGANAMKNNKTMTTLVIGSNVSIVGASAFAGCKKLSTVTIGSNVASIGKGAFKGCKKLGKVTVKSAKLAAMGKQAFKGCKSSLKVKVPAKQLKKYKKMFTKAGLKTKQVKK